MTGTASSMGRTFMDFDNYRNREWLRRRKLRLEQVRKQSNDIAKALRQKVIDSEKARLDEYERISEANFRDWKAEKLAELEWKLRSALEEFGESHRHAEEESELEEIIIEKNKINLAKAQRRGEIAQQEEFKKKKMAEEKKLSPIQRKQMARKKEDLRSALVCSVPLKKQLLDSKEVNEEKTYPKEISTKKEKRRKMIPHKSSMCKCKTPSKNFPLKGPETVWINLNEIQTCQTSDSGLQLKTSKSSTSNGKSQKEKPEGTVEFYDFSSRYHSKSFREFPHLVERIDLESEVPNANELAEIEEKNEKEEAKKKMEVDALRQERGTEALKREKIQRDYNNLIAKLEELNKKEKILKAQQRNAPRFFHMNDERLSERTRTKQRMMDEKFESIYYAATAQIPQLELPRLDIGHSHGGGDYAQSDDGQSVRLSFSSSNIKPNTPATSQGESSESTSETTRRPRKVKKKQQLLLDIDRALKEGRELRKTASRHWESKDFGEEEENEKKMSSSYSDSEMSKAKNVESSPPKNETKMRSQESQTDDLKDVEESGKEKDLKGSDKTDNDSLPVSSSTSYKSPPSVIRSCRLRQFLASLEGVNEGGNEKQGMLNTSASNKDIDKLFYDLLEKNLEKPLKSLTLEYYIEKLLNMSRECIANLSVSSENISTPNITDLEVKDEKVSDVEYSCTASSHEEDIIKKSTLDRATQLEKTIKNWKKIFEKNSEKVSGKDSENDPDSPYPRLVGSDSAENNAAVESSNVICSENVKNRYEEISKKCSERISELSDMLDKVRRDKEKLLGSTSGGSSLSLNKDEKTFQTDSGGAEEEEGGLVRSRTSSLDKRKTPAVLDSFVNRYNLSISREESASATAIADSQSFVNPEESVDSWPDVMDELLKKEILTSPFKWSDGEYSSEFTKITDSHTKPSSIETVIGNFRREIKKIKPFSLSNSFSECNSEMHPRHSSNGGYVESFCPQRKWTSTENGPCLQEESSVESINHALTSLGLYWAKSFLRKNEESRAMSSSSNSVEKSSGEEDDDFH